MSYLSFVILMPNTGGLKTKYGKSAPQRKVRGPARMRTRVVAQVQLFASGRSQSEPSARMVACVTRRGRRNCGQWPQGHTGRYSPLCYSIGVVELVIHETIRPFPSAACNSHSASRRRPVPTLVLAQGGSPRHLLRSPRRAARPSRPSLSLQGSKGQFGAGLLHVIDSIGLTLH